MPRFYFNVYDGVALPDLAGVELKSWPDARFEAIRLAGAILRDEAKRIALTEDWRMEVTDENGLVLFRLDFTVLESAVTQGSRRPEEGAV